MVVGKQHEEDFGTQVVDVIRGDRYASRMGGMVDHVDEQSKESVDEILPGSWFFGQAALQQVAINLG